MTVLVVLGMHRSGTSLVAGVLHRMGWGVGPEDQLMPAKPDNPRGFVEHLPAVRVNDRLLYRLGGSWKRPPGLPPGWEHDTQLDDLRDEAARVIDHLVGSETRPVLMKDPRFSLTLPFWQTVVDVPQVALVVREPNGVIASLLRREADLDRSLAADLYVRYLLAGLRADAAVRVVHADLFAGASAEDLQRLAKDLGGAPTDMQVESARLQIEPSLWGRSARSMSMEPVPDTPTGLLASWLHFIVRSDAGPADLTALGLLEPRSALGAMDQAHRVQVEQHAERLEQALAGRDRLREERDRCRATLGSVRDERDRRGAHAQELQEKLDDAQAKWAAVRQERDALRADIESLRAAGDADA